MLRNRIYYGVKPFLPQRMRMAVRRKLAMRRRPRVSDIWPIMPGSERPPQGWSGWPEGKKFAVVLTHDVEGQSGLDKCRALMKLEMELGFRSSFNFIPEGSYRVSSALRHELTGNGFEVGVHDLKHDGRLFHSAAEFRARGMRINQYLRDWNAVGFRSGFMLHNLDWLHDLEIEYDMSTFDTDPFEPQPEGRHTIFPFWVQARATPRLNGSTPRRGYAELPYTLPQDSTLFLLLGETSSDIWKNKLDWIVSHGGLVLLDTHPDYMSFDEAAPASGQYPVRLYRELLEYLHSKYADQYWHALPARTALHVRAVLAQPAALPFAAGAKSISKVKPKIWIDLDNTPHIPFFEPIVDELKTRGFPVFITARDAFQVCDLADKKGLKYLKIGRHHGKNPLLKAGGLVYRSLQLAPAVLREKPVLGVSHGARSQLLLGTWLRLPTVLIEDYEYCKFPIMMRPSWVMAPRVIQDNMLPCSNGNIRKYSGIKEDVYVWKLAPDSRVLNDLGIFNGDLVVTVRPPATEAHYHNPESERLFERFMERASQATGVKVVLLPRNIRQARHLETQWPGWFKKGGTVIPETALDGLNLLWHSDLVVSGGGTMNREAAALGVPVYSIFRGAIGAVDRHLSAEGRLVLIESLADVENKIKLVKRTRGTIADVTSRKTLTEIVDNIAELAETCRRSNSLLTTS